MILLTLLIIGFFCTEHGRYLGMKLLVGFLGLSAWFFTFPGLVLVAYLLLVNK